MADNMNFVVSATDSASPVLNNIKKNIDGVTTAAQTNSQKLQDWSKKNREGFAAIGIAAGLAFAGITSFMQSSIKAAEDYQRAMAQMGAALKSTNDASGMTTKSLSELASQLSIASGIQDEVVMSAENMMLTFTQVGSKAFPDATKAAIDMATAMNGGLVPSTDQARESALRLGIALNDPEKGYTRLHRVGVEFTAQQENQIKTLQKSGDMFGAQKVILDELAKEFGGSAAANAATFEGQMNALNVQFDEMKRSVGEALQPALAGLMATIQPIVKGIETWVEGHKELTKNILIVAAAITGLLVLIAAVGLAIGPLIAGFEAFGAIAVAACGGIEVALAVLTGPIGLVIAGIAALVIGVKLLEGANKGTSQSYTELESALTENKNKQAELKDEYDRGIITLGDYQAGTARLKTDQTDLQGKLNNTTMTLEEMRAKIVEVNGSNLSSKEKVAELMKIKDAADAATLSLNATLTAAKNLLVEQQAEQTKRTAVEQNGFGSQVYGQGSAGGILDANILKSISSVVALTKAQSDQKKVADDATNSLKKLGVTFGDTANAAGNLAVATSGTAKKVEDYTKDMKKDFQDFCTKSMDSLTNLKQKFEDDMDSLKTKAQDIMKQLSDINKQYSTDTADNNKTMAEEIIAQDKKVADLKKQIADKLAVTGDTTVDDAQKKLTDINARIADRLKADAAIGNDSTKDSYLNDLQSQAKAKQEILDLQTQLTTEVAAQNDTAGMKITLTAEIAEAQRRAGLTEIQRQLEDYQTTKQLQQQQYNDKQTQLQNELSAVKNQQTQITAAYTAAQAAIKLQVQKGFKEYADGLTDQANLTKQKVDDMKSYYDGLAASIQKAVDAANRLSTVSMRASTTKGYADGGVISGGITPFATGGIVSSPTLGLIGEGQYNEAVVPLPNGSSIPVEMRGGGGIVINIGNLYGTDDEAAKRFANAMVQQFKGQYSFEGF